MSDERVPLKAIQRRIFQSRGILYEADVFSILRHSPYTIRSFEFGVVDGAIDCSRSHAKSSSYADRFWDLLYQLETPSDLLYFDVKNTVGSDPGYQIYLTSHRQRSLTAFVIGIAAADPTFVDVIPNYHQSSEALDENAADPYSSHDGARGVAANVSRRCKLPSREYGGLDQCGTPYRLPISMLSLAIARIRRCITHGEMYVNPWTGVAFPDWQPRTGRSFAHLKPAEHTEQFSAYEVAIEIFRHARSRVNMALEFPACQPRLADFRLTVDDQHFWIQHKLDNILRSQDNTFERVAIARVDEQGELKHYFSTFDRFDFLWYQFTISTGAGVLHPDQIFYLIPEGELPDEFYSATDDFADFATIRNLQDYRVHMDAYGAWILDVESIIRRHPSPRSTHERPIRPTQLAKMLDTIPLSDAPVLLKGVPSKHQGRHDYASTLARSQQCFYYSIMERCAKRGLGLLVLHATNHPLAEMGYLRYKWSTEQQKSFAQEGRPPCAAHNLPPDVEVVPIMYYTQHAETSFDGPNVRPAQYRRMNSCAERRLLVWDLGGPDTAARPLMPAVIPTEDIQPSESQAKIMKHNVTINKSAGRAREKNENPTLSALLNNGLHCSEYAVGNEGPLFYADSGQRWSAVLDLLDKFSQLPPFEHPLNHIRNPADYRHTLQFMHQRLQDQQRFSSGEMEDEHEEQDQEQ